MMTAAEARQEQEQTQVVLERARAAAAEAVNAQDVATADLKRETDRLAETQAKVAEHEKAISHTVGKGSLDPFSQAFTDTLTQLELERARVRALEPRAKAALAATRLFGEKLAAANQAVTEASADLAFAKYRERSAELRELLVTICKAAADQLASLTAARSEFDAVATLPAIPYQRADQALAPEAIKKSTRDIGAAGYLVAVAEQLVKGQSGAEESIGWYEKDGARRAGEQVRQDEVIERLAARQRASAATLP